MTIHEGKDFQQAFDAMLTDVMEQIGDYVEAIKLKRFATDREANEALHTVTLTVVRLVQTFDTVHAWAILQAISDAKRSE